MDRMEKFLQKTIVQTKGLTKDLMEKFNLSSAQFLGKVVDIAGKRLRIKELVGEGGFGFVFLCQEFNSNEHYIMKRVYAQDPASIESIETEIRILETLPPHGNVVHYLGSSKNTIGRGQFEYTILLEYCSGGSLFDLVNRWSKNGQRQTEQRVLGIFKEICQAVSHLHSRDPPIAHRDLKLENILLDETGTCKLIDFGSCTSRAKVYESRHEMEEEDEIIQKTTTMVYRAPEMVDLYRKQLISEKVDVWALGCILYSLAYLKHPFQNGTTLQILNSSIHYPDNPQYSAEFMAILQSMFTPNPVQRPSSTDVLISVNDLIDRAGFTRPKSRTHSRTPSAASDKGDASSEAPRIPPHSPAKSPTAPSQAIGKSTPDFVADFDSQFASLTTSNPTTKTSTPTSASTTASASWDPFSPAPTHAASLSNASTTQARPPALKSPPTSNAAFDPFAPSASTTSAATSAATSWESDLLGFGADPKANASPFASTNSFNPALSPTSKGPTTPSAAWQSVTPTPSAFKQGPTTASAAPQQFGGFQPIQNQQSQQGFSTAASIAKPQQQGFAQGWGSQPAKTVASAAPMQTQSQMQSQMQSQTQSQTQSQASIATAAKSKSAASPFDMIDPFARKGQQATPQSASASNFSNLAASDLKFFEN